MWLGTRGSKENTGRSSPNISVGAIFNDTARVFPAEKQFPIGESLMQVILSPQEAADFLYFLMNVISMESARMITPSTAPISFYRRGLDERYGPGTAHALEERYRDSHFKGKIAKEWRPKEYEAKIIELQEKLAALTPEVAY